MKQEQPIQKQEENPFIKRNIGYLFYKFGIPSAVCMLFVGLQTIVDGFFVGNYAGANAMAGISLVVPIYTLITAIVVIMGVGCQTVMGISSGQGNYQRASDALRSSLVFLMALAFCLVSLFLIFSSELVTLLGANALLFPYSKDYLTTLSPFFPLLILLFMGDYYLKSRGKPMLGLCIVGSMVLLNILLDYLLIARLALGVRGAALATGLSFSAGALCSIIYMFRANSKVTVRKGKFKWSLVGQMLYNGSSEGVAELSAGITVFLFNRALMSYAGASGVAAFTAINYLLYIGILIFVGMSDGIIPVISYNYGASRMKRVLRLLRMNVVVNFILGIIIFGAIYIAGSNLISLFFDSSEESASTIALAVNGAKFCAFAFLFNGTNIAISSFFTAMGDAKSSIMISAMRGLIFVAIGIYIYPLWLGIDGIWLAIPIAELLTLTFGTFWLRHETKLKRLKEHVKNNTNIHS